MSTEIYNNFNPKKTSPLDERLVAVSTYASLPDPNSSTTFIYEGAIIHVKDELVNYQAQELSPGTLSWVNIGGITSSATVVGSINLLPNSTILDCNLVSPSISTCHSVIINIIGGNTVNINSITNLPVIGDNSDLITFYAENGKTVKFVHNDYDTAASGQIVLEDGFDMLINGRSIGNESLTLKNDGGVNTQFSAVQYIKKGELSTSFTSLFDIENSLTSTSTTKALSALQGKLLNDNLNLKQDTLTSGNHISIVGSTITASPWVWEKYTGTVPHNVDPVTFLPSVFGIGLLSDKYRWVDLGENAGTWVCPPFVSPNTYGNWFQFDRPKTKILSARYTFVADATFTAVGTNYNPRISTSAYDGDVLGLTFNADGPATEKVSILLPQGTYKVKAKLNVEADNHNDLIFNLYTTNGLTTAAAGVPGTNVLKDVAFTSSPTTAWTNSDQDSYEVEALVIVGSTPGLNDALIFGLTSTSGFTNTSSYTAMPGYLDITKIK